MASTISALRVVENNYDADLLKKPPSEQLRRALAGEQAALALVLGRPQFIFEFTNTVATSSVATVLNLTDTYSVELPPEDSMQAIDMMAYIGDASVCNRLRIEDTLQNVGGTTTVIDTSGAVTLDQDAGDPGGAFNLEISSGDVIIETNGTWTDDVYKCILEVYIKPPVPAVSAV